MSTEVGVSALDRMLATQASPARVARELIAEARAGLQQFCEIPEGYRGCRLDHAACRLEELSEAETRNLIEAPSGALLNPAPTHLQAAAFFRMILDGDPLVCEKGDPLRPTLGAYLVGPPGAGKTHIMAAFGLLIKERLDKELARLEAAITGLVERLYEETLDQLDAWSQLSLDGDNRWVLSGSGPAAGLPTDSGDDSVRRALAADIKITKCRSPEERFALAAKALQHRVRAYIYQPTDMLYLGFEDLFDQLQKDKAHHARMVAALETARVLFIDDIHPKGDPERIRVIQQLIERRYELDRPGTFLTTNLSAEELGAGDHTLALRLLSRCSESFVKFDFKDCADWRLTVRSRRIRWIEQAIKARLQ